MQKGLRIVVTGCAGQLGYAVMAEWTRRGYAPCGWDVAPMDGPWHSMLVDLTDEAAVQQAMQACCPDVVIHCAAWTAVDAAEDPGHLDKVRAVNVQATENLARACETMRCKMVYISTDYVFSGEGTTPWQPDCTDFAPLNAYGRTKLMGEEAVRNRVEKHFIVRTSWVFGPHGANFVRTMLSIGQKYDTVRVVNDQIGRPTYTVDLARLLADMALSERYGTYHATNAGSFISWYDFACEIYRQAGCAARVAPVTTAEYGLSRAARPFNSRMDTSKLAENGFAPLPDWRDALTRYLAEME